MRVFYIIKSSSARWSFPQVPILNWSQKYCDSYIYFESLPFLIPTSEAQKSTRYDRECVCVHVRLSRRTWQVPDSNGTQLPFWIHINFKLCWNERRKHTNKIKHGEGLALAPWQEGSWCVCVCVYQTAAYRVWHEDHCWRHSLSASRCWGVQGCFCVCVCISIYVFLLPLPACQKCVSPITCLSDITVECGNAHLTHRLRRSSRGVCVCVCTGHKKWSNSSGPPLLGLVTVCECS